MSTAISLVGKGVAFGAIHVLTGPDHLSALATLSANLGNCKAFELGVRWGLGHSSGLLIVGIPLIILNDSDTVEMSRGLENAFETLVGVFMLLLGTYGMIRAFQTRTNETLQHEEMGFAPVANNVDIQSSGHHLEESDIEMSDPPQTENTNPATPFSIHAALGANERMDMTTDQRTPIQMMSMDDTPMSRWKRFWIYLSALPSSFAHTHDVYDEDKVLPRQCSYKLMAIGIGVVHGVAGPGGVLGLIPAVNLHDWVLATIYLSSFCLSSTIIMGCYAALYGTLTARVGWGQEFYISCFSAALSILVGITWLVLLSIGKLHDVFP